MPRDTSPDNDKKRSADDFDNSNHTAITEISNLSSSSQKRHRTHEESHWTDIVKNPGLFRSMQKGASAALIAGRMAEEESQVEVSFGGKEKSYDSKILDIIAEDRTEKSTTAKREKVINAISNPDSHEGRLYRDIYNDIVNSLNGTNKER